MTRDELREEVAKELFDRAFGRGSSAWYRKAWDALTHTEQRYWLHSHATDALLAKIDKYVESERASSCPLCGKNPPVSGLLPCICDDTGSAERAAVNLLRASYNAGVWHKRWVKLAEDVLEPPETIECFTNANQIKGLLDPSYSSALIYHVSRLTEYLYWPKPRRFTMVLHPEVPNE